MILVTKWFGTFLVEEKRVVTQILFPAKDSEIAERLLRIQKGEILSEERKLAEKRKLQVLEARLAPLGRLSIADTSFIVPAKYGYDQSLLVSALTILARTKVREQVGFDRHLSEAITAYDEMKEAANSLEVRIHSWFGLHYPELFDILKGRSYVETVSRYGDRKAIQEALGLPDNSIGIELLEAEDDALRNMASLVLKINESAEKLGSFIDRKSAEVFPNLSALLGPKLACRVVRGAGGLEHLSRMPSGSIQLIGAEKALFRHLNRGRKPPKHGIIFQEPLIHSSPKEYRGRIARRLAGNIAIAARLDMFHGSFRGDRMRRDFEEKVSELIGGGRKGKMQAK
ncbi:MAG: NOP58 family protein [Thermoplasmata archaeon]|uniref:NOP58 family protein n=1 Tax=Candidatus Sysuiplasma superficiale TaxID=2823368 RepID=A0A8J8CDP5_9ARCH|nr:NOP58 family protein [Candidatus Sysuiplasma superficiale]MBX8644769.1 NOP58 family protein [Candidatus Sysuiplasma superficiale]MCL4347053.1 NOP58 family protein [Candidatus Thermoplasmatota archaeon]